MQHSLRLGVQPDEAQHHLMADAQALMPGQGVGAACSKSLVQAATLHQRVDQGLLLVTVGHQGDQVLMVKCTEDLHFTLEMWPALLAVGVEYFDGNSSATEVATVDGRLLPKGGCGPASHQKDPDGS